MALKFFALVAMPLLVLVSPVQAQTVLHDTLSAAQASQSSYSGGSFTSQSFRAPYDATITGVVIQLGTNTTADATTIENNGKFELDYNDLTFVSYDSATRLATFSTNQTFSSGDFVQISVGCSSCGSAVIATSLTNATDDWYEFQGYRIRLTGTIPNVSPVLSSIGNQTHRENEASVSVTTGATDANSGDTLTYSASGLPTGLSINTGTGTITGTPTVAGTLTGLTLSASKAF